MEADAQRWEAMWETFHAVLEAPPSERNNLLARRCGGDHALRAEVEALLASHESLGTFLETEGHFPRADRPTESRLAPGTVLGRYTIDRWIGSGGMGVVYAARQTRPERTVALKLVRERFEREIETLGRLNHPGIATLYEAGTLHMPSGHEQPFIAMELVEGQPLLEFAQDRRLLLAERLELLARIADAVHHANQRGVLHGDLKPSNIMVTKEGQPKVLDFGVARFIEDGALIMTRSEIDLAGTLPYMSPERFTGDRSQITALNDVYALGVVGYQLFAGRLPFAKEPESIFEMLEIIRAGATVRLGKVDPSLRGDVETVIHLAIDPDPQRRYQSAAVLAAELRRIVRHEPIIGETRGWWYRTVRFVQRNRAATAAALVVTLALIAATAISTRQAVRATAAEQRSRRNVETLWRFVQAVLYQIHDGIAPLPGSTPVRRDLVNTALGYLEEIRADAGEDPAFLLDLAVAYERLGDVLGNAQMPNLGDIDAARARYDAALSIVEPLHARFPDDVQIAHAVGRMNVRRAEAAAPGEGAGLEPGLIDRLGRGVAILRTVVSTGGGAGARLDLAHALIMDGWERQSEGEPEALLARGREALALAESVAASAPGDDAIAHELAVVRGWYGYMLIDQNQPAPALEVLIQARDWLEAHRAAHPLDSSAALIWARIEAWRGWALVETGHPTKGLALVGEAADLAMALAQANPEDQRFVRQLEVSTTMLARLHIKLGEAETTPTTQRQEHFAQAAILYTDALNMLAQRTRRGWTRHWEAHYEEMYASAARRAAERRDAMAGEAQQPDRP